MIKLALLIVVIALLMHTYDLLVNRRNQVVIKGDKPTIMLFYVDWCGYCKKFMPDWERLSGSMSDNANFVKLNGDKETSMAEKYNVKQYPTIIKVYKNGKMVVYEDEREMDKLVKFCKK